MPWSLRPWQREPANWLRRGVSPRGGCSTAVETPCRAKLHAMAPSTVRGLTLPSQLTSLVDRGLWRHPGDAVLAEVIPWFEDPLVFVSNPKQMEFASQTMDMLADDPHCAFFRVARESNATGPLELPWLDTADQRTFPMPTLRGATPVGCTRWPLMGITSQRRRRRPRMAVAGTGKVHCGSHRSDLPPTNMTEPDSSLGCKTTVYSGEWASPEPPDPCPGRCRCRCRHSPARPAPCRWP